MHYPNIKNLREQFKFKQDYVAAKLNMEQPEYSRLENGKKSPKPEDLAILAELYGTTVDALMHSCMSDAEHKYELIVQGGSPKTIMDRLINQNEKLIERLFMLHDQNSAIIKQLLSTGKAS